MPKKETLKRPSASKKDTPDLKKFDSKKAFREMGIEELSEVLFEIWMERDIESFKSILSSYLDAHNKQRIAKAMGVSRNTLYHMVSEDGNPTLDTVFRLLDAIEEAA